MPRTVKHPEERRAELIDIAQKLFYTKGYERTSVSDIVKEVGVAQGTFYYYFDSKEAVLEAMSERMIDHVSDMLAGIVENPDIGVLEKLRRFIVSGNQWKLEQRDAMLKTARHLLQPGNALMTLRLGEYRRRVMTPVFSQIVANGCAEGIFDVDYPHEMAITLLAIAESYNRELTRLLLADESPEIDHLATAKQLTINFNTAYRRLLGVTNQSFTFVDPTFLEPWFQK